jgi:hypothetical protein
MNWFGEKAQQVDAGPMKAFGVKILSRYQRASEIREMLDFCEGLARMRLAQYVMRVFYDSGADLCSIESVPGFDHRYGGRMESIRGVALMTLSQFECNGLIEHKTSDVPEVFA